MWKAELEPAALVVIKQATATADVVVAAFNLHAAAVAANSEVSWHLGAELKIPVFIFTVQTVPEPVPLTLETQSPV